MASECDPVTHGRRHFFFFFTTILAPALFIQFLESLRLGEFLD